MSSILYSYSFPTETIALASTGKLSPSNPSILNDIATIYTTATKLVELGKKVIIVIYSSRGFIGLNAIEGLGISTRGEVEGGIIKPIFLATAIFRRDLNIVYFRFLLSIYALPLRLSFIELISL